MLDLLIGGLLGMVAGIVIAKLRHKKKRGVTTIDMSALKTGDNVDISTKKIVLYK